MTAERTPHSILPDIREAFRLRGDEGVEIRMQVLDAVQRLEEQFEAHVEAFRAIAEKCGEDGTDPDSWRAMTFPGPMEYALMAVGRLRSDYDEALRALPLLPSQLTAATRSDGSSPANNPDDLVVRDMADREIARIPGRSVAHQDPGSEESPTPLTRPGGDTSPATKPNAPPKNPSHIGPPDSPDSNPERSPASRPS
jgi:hypothetical protein